MAEHRTYTEGNEDRGFRGECMDCPWRGERYSHYEPATADRRAHARKAQQTAEPSDKG